MTARSSGTILLSQSTSALSFQAVGLQHGPRSSRRRQRREKKNGKIYLNKLLSSPARTPLTWSLIDHLRRRRRRPPDIMHVQFGSFAGFSGRSSPDVQPKVGSGGWTTVSVVSIKTPSDNREKVAGEWCKRTFFILIRFFAAALLRLICNFTHARSLCWSPGTVRNAGSGAVFMSCPLPSCCIVR